MPIIGALRIKNESRWIERVVRSIQPICERIVIFDDHSSDGTDEMCVRLGCDVYRSQFSGIDESRDKDFLLSKVFTSVPNPSPTTPHWCLNIDGDEQLHPSAINIIRSAVGASHNVYSLRVLYLWDSPDQVRMDGVYRSFYRPSLFRLMSRNLRYRRTANGGHFHCSNIPAQLSSVAQKLDASLLHYGYMEREDRLRKYAWYNKVDPGNVTEDCYRHMVQGDVPEIPADCKLKWSGPLMIRKLQPCGQVA